MRLLVSGFQAGDPQATNELFERVQDRMSSMARTMLRRFPRLIRWVQEEDIVQEAMVRMLRALRDISPQSMRLFYGLAAEQIRRELIDLSRKLFGPEGPGANYESHMFLNEGEVVTASVAEPIAPVDPIEELERWTVLHEAVEYLDTGAREVFCLTFYHGWGQRDIAELMHVDERTVRRRWCRAILILSGRLGGKLPPDIQNL
jgi:RNA polymerase sigma-70 factor (ECF subfamily)